MSEVAEKYFKKLGSMLDTEMEAAKADIARRQFAQLSRNPRSFGKTVSFDIPAINWQKWDSLQIEVNSDAPYGLPRVGKDSSKQSQNFVIQAMLAEQSMRDLAKVYSSDEYVVKTEPSTFSRFLEFMKGFLK